MSLSPREELLRLQRQLFRHNQALIAQSVQVREPGFVAYERRYRRAVATYERVVSDAAMLQTVERSQLVFVGDYHTCPQSQRSFLRLLKAMVGQGRPLLIGLELLHRRTQRQVEAYLLGTIDEATFVQRAGLRSHWVFDLWENFRPIFDFARYHRIPVVPIDAAAPGATLAARDRATGQWLAELLERYPEHRLLVLIGDLHLAPAHLPRAAARALATRGRAARTVTLFQNSEAIYWRLARLGKEHSTQVVRIDADHYCRMHTPPVVCQQSYLNWLEHDEGAIDFADAKHQFLELVQRIAAFVRVPLPPLWDDLTVYTCGDLSFLTALRRSRRFSPRQLGAIRRHVLQAESYLIPSERIVYLANLSLNHAGEEAAHYVKTLAAGIEQRPRERVDAFFAQVLHEALGFFGSKLISHRRKCFHEPQFRALRGYLDRQAEIPAERRLEYETACVVLHMTGRRQPDHEIIAGLASPLTFAVTHALGYMLGDRMFYAVLSRRLGRRTVRDLFLDPWQPGAAQSVYEDLRARLRHVKIPSRM